MNITVVQANPPIIKVQTPGIQGASAAPDVRTDYTKQQNFLTATLVDAANIDWNLDNAQVARVTLGGDRTMNAPTNLVDGGTYVLMVKQDAIGGRTLAWNALFAWPSGATPVLSTSPNALDIFTFVCDGSKMHGVITQDLR